MLYLNEDKYTKIKKDILKLFLDNDKVSCDKLFMLCKGSFKEKALLLFTLSRLVKSEVIIYHENYFTILKVPKFVKAYLDLRYNASAEFLIIAYKFYSFINDNQISIDKVWRLILNKSYYSKQTCLNAINELQQKGLIYAIDKSKYKSYKLNIELIESLSLNKVLELVQNYTII